MYWSMMQKKDLKWTIESIEIDSGDGRLYIFLFCIKIRCEINFLLEIIRAMLVGIKYSIINVPRNNWTIERMDLNWTFVYYGVIEQRGFCLERANSPTKL